MRKLILLFPVLFSSLVMAKTVLHLHTDGDDNGRFPWDMELTFEKAIYPDVGEVSIEGGCQGIYILDLKHDEIRVTFTNCQNIDLDFDMTWDQYYALQMEGTPIKTTVRTMERYSIPMETTVTLVSKDW